MKCPPRSGHRARRAGVWNHSGVRLLLVTPPMIQLNTPYPATAYLTGFLRQQARDRGLALDVRQADPALALFLRLFSRAGLAEAAGQLRAAPAPKGKRRRGVADPTASVQHFLA